MRMPNLTVLIGTVAALSACGGMTSAVAPDAAKDAPTVLALSPANATLAADPAKPIVITFNRPMMAGMESLVVLHEGTVTGPAVAGVASWSADRAALTFTASAPLKAHATYTLHLSPSLKSAGGQSINLGACTQLGGQYATAAMMGISSGAGMMNSTWGPGMMGDGWRAADGTYGMVFTFATA